VIVQPHCRGGYPVVLPALPLFTCSARVVRSLALYKALTPALCALLCRHGRPHAGRHGRARAHGPRRAGHGRPTRHVGTARARHGRPTGDGWPWRAWGAGWLHAARRAGWLPGWPGRARWADAATNAYAGRHAAARCTTTAAVTAVVQRQWECFRIRVVALLSVCVWFRVMLQCCRG
jgi:hypothetical protein